MLELVLRQLLRKTLPFINVVFQYPIALYFSHSVVGIATGYGLDDRGVGVQVAVGSRIFSSPRRPD
jgi:hypothetical protein